MVQNPDRRARLKEVGCCREFVCETLQSTFFVIYYILYKVIFITYLVLYYFQFLIY